MSCTTTLKTIQEGSILLSPLKKHRSEPGVGPSAFQCSDETPVILPPDSDLYKWTFTRDAVAPCFIKDVFDMKENRAADFDFFWLGRVPCRTVQIVALVVGVQQYENYTTYTVDDGTAVIDCIYRHAQPPSTPKKRLKKNGNSLNDLSNNIQSIPLPIASVGDSIRLQGKVMRLKESRRIKVEHGDLFLCRSTSDEPQHWIRVIDSHQNDYDLQEPFKIPPHSVLPVVQDITGAVPKTPSASTAASCHVTAINPEPTHTHKSPARLRHPSRLHSRDLTDMTFSIYVKHYMDNAPTYRPLLQHSLHEEVIDDSCFATPTPANRRRNELLESPTPKRHHTCSASRLSDDDGVHFTSPKSASEYGFSLSYLRRVPDLALLARRVVEAERKRRDRELRRQAKEAAKSPSTESTSSLIDEKKKASTESVSKKMKRLFIKTIRDLYSDGKIVLWDGPVRVWSSAYCLDRTSLSTNPPWKSFVSADASTLVSSTVSTPSSFTSHDVDFSIDDDLSDPEENEESYISVTNRRVAKLVEGAITKLSGCSKSGRAKHVGINEILKFIHGDARWANIGEFAAEEALELLQADEVIYKVGNGRWALCI